MQPGDKQHDERPPAPGRLTARRLIALALTAVVVVVGAARFIGSRSHFLHAVHTGNLIGARASLWLGADVESCETWGWQHTERGHSALTSAAKKGDDRMVRLLLDYGAGVNQSDGLNQPPLWCAAWGGHASTVKLLLAAGANAAAPGGDGSALHAAASMRHFEVCDLLLKAGVPVDIRDTQGKTPLHWAAFRADPDAVRYLLEQGADAGLKTPQKKTPLDLVKMKIAGLDARHDEYLRSKDKPEPDAAFRAPRQEVPPEEWEALRRPMIEAQTLLERATVREKAASAPD